MIGPRRSKTCSPGLRTMNAQTSLRISAFIIRLHESIISKICYKQNFDFLASLCSRGDWFESRFVGKLSRRDSDSLIRHEQLSCLIHL